MKTARKGRAWSAAGDVDERRDAIMRGLNTVLRERGPAPLRMQDVADHLGLVKGNLYYYFKNKEELVYHAHVKCVEVSLAALARARASKAAPAERLRTLIREHILAMTEGEYGGVLLLEDIEKLTPAHRRKYVALRDEFERGVRELIKAGIASGDFAKQDARTAGFAMLGGINWIPKWYRPDGEMSAGAVADCFAEFFMRALRA